MAWQKNYLPRKITPIKLIELSLKKDLFGKDMVSKKPQLRKETKVLSFQETIFKFTKILV